MIDGDGTLPHEAPMNSHGHVIGSYTHPDVRMTMEVWVDPGLPVEVLPLFWWVAGHARRPSG
ncbi:MAG: hypothetical protein OXQ94_12475, partial [Gemmatimonadota bacterium]|nr:hypothetical protein [Gemmatimonadota bacterium]MDE2872487.1 hypothetical protein [Gemmatimonadota bacterium]